MATKPPTTKVNCREVMTKALACYRAAYGNSPRFHRDCFAVALKMEWRTARFAAERAAEQAVLDRENAERAARPVRFMGQIVPGRPMSEMEQRIDDLKYLPFRFSTTRMEADIRAEYAAVSAWSATSHDNAAA